MVATQETLRADVKVGDIFLDESYGRLPQKAHVERLVANWDRSRVGVIYLSMRADGRFAVLDGNHRVVACRVAEGDDGALPARVYLDLSVKDEAELFAAFNKDRKALRPAEIFRARLSAGDKSAREIHAIVQSLGYDISWDGRAGSGIVQSVASLEKVYNTYGADMLREVLITLRNTMGAFRASTVLGLAAFLVRYRDAMDRARLYAVLESHSFEQWHSTARAVQSMTPAINNSTAFGMALVQLYNTGLRSKHLPPWQARGVYGEKSKVAMRVTALRNLGKLDAAKEALNEFREANRG